MKKISLVLFCSVIGMFFLGCHDPKEPKDAQKQQLQRQVVLLTDLALKAQLTQGGCDSLCDSICHQTQLLYKASQEGNSDLSSTSTFSTSCCCPCDASAIIISSSSSETSASTTADSTTCPCPGAADFIIASKSGATLQVDAAPPLMPSDSSGTWKFLSLQGVPDGEHFLTIRGNFTGDGIRSYLLPITMSNGKPYIKGK